MPKRTREDFLSIQRLYAAVDALAADATPSEVAARCASAMMKVLGTGAVVIHRRDVHGPDARELFTRERAAYPVMRGGECIAMIEVVGVERAIPQTVKDACAIVAQRFVAAIDAEVERELIESEMPPTRRFPELPRSSLGSSSRNLDDRGDRLVVRCSERDDRSAHVIPATFPKRAPTLRARSSL